MTVSELDISWELLVFFCNNPHLYPGWASRFLMLFLQAPAVWATSSPQPMGAGGLAWGDLFWDDLPVAAGMFDRGDVKMRDLEERTEGWMAQRHSLRLL